MGAYGFVFSDFGKAFSVRDLNGEAPTSRIITDVSDARLGLEGVVFPYCGAVAVLLLLLLILFVLFTYVEGVEFSLDPSFVANSCVFSDFTFGDYLVFVRYLPGF